MPAQTVQTRAEQDLANQFGKARTVLPGDAWVGKLRADAWDAYAATGLPHRRIEEWKYTDLRALLKQAYPPAPALAVALSRDDVARALESAMAAIDCTHLVVVDGQFRPELSDVAQLKGDCEVLSLAEALGAPPAWVKERLARINPCEGDPLTGLNLALMSGGVALRIADGSAMSRPLHIVHVAAAKEPASIATRNLVVAGAGAALTLIESYVSRSGAPAQRNAVTELDAGEGARVEHVKYQKESGDSAHLSTWMTRLGTKARYRAFQFSTGGAVARNQIFVRFAGEGASSHVNGAVMAGGRQHNDTTMVIDHAVPGCESREFNKLVLDGEARGIVQCRVNVHRDAQRSDGHQMAQGLLLSEAAEFDSKPELEIFADDVICGHGSTSGQVDENLMFYLRSRGIPPDQARALLITAFVGEVIETIESEPVRDAFVAIARAWLSDHER